MGRLISGPEVAVIRGSVLIPMKSPNLRLEVIEVEYLYQGDYLIAKQITLNPQQ